MASAAQMARACRSITICTVGHIYYAERNKIGITLSDWSLSRNSGKRLPYFSHAFSQSGLASFVRFYTSLSLSARWNPLKWWWSLSPSRSFTYGHFLTKCWQTIPFSMQIPTTFTTTWLLLNRRAHACTSLSDLRMQISLKNSNTFCCWVLKMKWTPPILFKGENRIIAFWMIAI